MLGEPVGIGLVACRVRDTVRRHRHSPQRNTASIPYIIETIIIETICAGSSNFEVEVVPTGPLALGYAVTSLLVSSFPGQTKPPLVKQMLPNLLSKGTNCLT